MNDKDKIITIVLTIAVFIIIFIAMLPSLQNPQTIQSLIIIGIIFTVVAVIRLFKRGVLPQELISKHLPLPLTLLKPEDVRTHKLYDEHVLEAIKETISLIEKGEDDKPYRIMKHIYDFFYYKELGFRPSNTDKLLERFKQIYSHITVKEERTSAAYSLACLVLWIFKYRNLTFHYPIKDPDPIDAWFALRTLLIYLKDKYRVKEAILYTQCPKCGNVNKTVLHEEQVRWFKEINITCSETSCGYRYKIALTPQVIREHYKLIREQ